MKAITEEAKWYAIRCHDTVNHLYDGHSYSVHLYDVVSAANKFIHLVPESDRGNVIAACWCHDVIEDCRETYNDVKAATNETVADLVYALTNEKGKTRKERAGVKYYAGIRAVPHAAFVKICDRIANKQYSKGTGSKMYNVYKQEDDHFIKSLYSLAYSDMLGYLRNI